MFFGKYMFVVIFFIRNEALSNKDLFSMKSNADHTKLPLLPKSCGEIIEDRLLPGKFASLYNFPWMALIAYATGDGEMFNCTGTVIHSKYILTAAYCVYNKNITRVRIGEHDLRQNLDCEGEGDSIICESYLQDIEIEEYAVHESYTGNITDNIALIRLKTPINFTNNAQPVCLPATEELLTAPIVGQQALTTGWALSTREPTVLRRDYITVFNLSTSATNKCAYLSKFLVAGEGGNGCVVDNGGPLVAKMKYMDNTKYVQFGIFSSGRALCNTQNTTIYTNVAKYMNWILNNIKD